MGEYRWLVVKSMLCVCFQFECDDGCWCMMLVIWCEGDEKWKSTSQNEK